MIYGRDNPTNEQVSSDLNIHVNFKIKPDVDVIFEFLSGSNLDEPITTHVPFPIENVYYFVVYSLKTTKKHGINYKYCSVDRFIDYIFISA